MSVKSIPAMQKKNTALGNGVTLSVRKQNGIMWKVSARLDLLLEEYDSIMTPSEASFILERLKTKYQAIDMQDLLELSDL